MQTYSVFHVRKGTDFMSRCFDEFVETGIQVGKLTNFRMLFQNKCFWLTLMDFSNCRRLKIHLELDLCL